MIFRLLILLTLTSCLAHMPKQKQPVCARNWDSKPLEVRVELAIGCSHVNGLQTYLEYKLEDIYDGND